MGNLNLLLDVTANNHTSIFESTLDSYGFQQLVKVQTNKMGHILDVVIVRKCPVFRLIKDDPAVTDSGVGDGKGHFTDHKAITVVANLPQPKRPSRTVSFRSIKNINVQNFKADLANTLAGVKAESSPSPDQLVTSLNTILLKVLDNHAPVITKKIII